jgi:hypothetical protein
MSLPNLNRENFRIFEFMGIRNLLALTLSAATIFEDSNLFLGIKPLDFISEENDLQRADNE